VEDEREILFVRYEDLCENQAEEIIRLANFLSKSIPAGRITTICERTSRAAMAKLQEIRPIVEKGYDMVRKSGNSQLLENELTEEMKDLIWQRCKIAMELFDYSGETSANSKGR
jgi:hypothetical protein